MLKELTRAVVSLRANSSDWRPLWHGASAVDRERVTTSLAYALLHQVPMKTLLQTQDIQIAYGIEADYPLALSEVQEMRSFWKRTQKTNGTLGEIIDPALPWYQPPDDPGPGTGEVPPASEKKPADSMLLRDYFENEYLADKVNLSEAAALNYRIAIRQLDAFNKSPVRLEDLTDRLLIEFMKHLSGNTENRERTVNNKRSSIRTVWATAAAAKLCEKPGKVTTLRVPRRVVQAWSIAEVSKILKACECAPQVGNSWNGRHWKALVLTIYDTSHRIGALLKTRRTALDKNGMLLVPAEVCKHDADTLQRLHPDTIAAIQELPTSDFLFPWPISKREIWRRFREILTAADLPATSRDLFHKLRRTSFTYTYALMGEDAARTHAAHSSDVTKSYLDRELVKLINNTPSPIDVLPRPAAS